MGRLLKRTLECFFRECNNQNISYCVLRNYEGLPSQTGRDIDILIDNSHINQVDEIIKKVSTEFGWFIFLNKKEESHYYYTLCRETEPFIINFDFQFDFRYCDIKYFDGNAVLKNRRQYKLFFIPPVGFEAVTLFLNSVLAKRFVKYSYRDLILKSYNANPEKFNDFLVRIVGQDLTLSVMALMTSEKWDRLPTYRNRIINRIRFNTHVSVLNETIYRIKHFSLKIMRILNPPGVFVALIGPDGVGKTTIATNLIKILENFFPKCCYIHSGYRMEGVPNIGGFLKSDKKKSCDRGGKNNLQHENRVLEYSRVIYHICSFMLGYYIKVLPAKRRRELVIADRYYYDIVVNPSRKNITLSSLFYRTFLPFVHRPDLLIILYADPQQIYRRKQELTLNEIKRQLNLYRKFGLRHKKTYFIKCEEDIEHTMKNILDIFAAFLKTKTSLNESKYGCCKR